MAAATTHTTPDLIIAAAPMLAQPQVFVQQAIDTLLHVHELVTGQQQRPGGHRREGELPTSLSEGYGRASSMTPLMRMRSALSTPVHDPHAHGRVTLLVNGHAEGFRGGRERLFGTRGCHIGQIDLPAAVKPVPVAADAAGTCMMPVIATHAIAAISRRHFLVWLSVEHDIRKIFPIFYRCSRIGRKIPYIHMSGGLQQGLSSQRPLSALRFHCLSSAWAAANRSASAFLRAASSVSKRVSSSATASGGIAKIGCGFGTGVPATRRSLSTGARSHRACIAGDDRVREARLVEVFDLFKARPAARIRLSRPAPRRPSATRAAGTAPEGGSRRTPPALPHASTVPRRPRRP